MSLVPSFNAIDDLQRFVRRVLRPVRGLGGVKVVDDDDGLTIFTTRGGRGRNSETPSVPIKLTAAGASVGFYAYTEQEWNIAGQTWQTKTGGITSDVLGEARELNLTAGLTTGDDSDLYYLSPSTMVRGDGSTIWEFSVSSAAPGMFPVKVQQTGGANGTNTSAATYTYTVRSLGWNGTTGGTVLGTNVSLRKPRQAGAVIVQSGSVGYGQAFYDGTTLVLWDAGERMNTGVCT